MKRFQATDPTDLHALRRGERAAQEQFLRQHAQRVFSLICRLVTNEQDAEELTQDVMVRALRHIEDYSPERASVDTWLAHIAYNTALNHLRRHQPPTKSLEEEDSVVRLSDDTFDTGAADTPLELLQEALNKLNPEEQTLISLYYYDDHPLRDIAYITGQPPSVLSTRLYRIRKKLYHLIQKHQTL